MLQKIKLFFFLFLLVSQLGAQDAHFTQYYQNAALINPSLVGNFKGLFRVGMNYRDQWRDGIGKPYSSFTATGESNFELGDKVNPDLAALGIMFLSDRVGPFALNSNQISLSGNYRKSLNGVNKQYIGVGFQTGVITKTINYEQITFGDQFNSIDAYTLDTKELLPGNNFGFFDLGLGVDYSITTGSRKNFNIGIAAHHLTRPNISFFAKESSPNNDLDLNGFLNTRFVAHASINLPLKGAVDIEPRALFMKQGQSNMFVIGSMLKYKNPTSEGKVLYAGPSLRFSNQYETPSLESMMLTVGYDYNGLNLGFSYDHNIPDLFNQRHGLGSFEFTITYIGQYENDDLFCPKF
jgi:type IX secretion system PorP/SprF family membrane protein